MQIDLLELHGDLLLVRLGKDGIHAARRLLEKFKPGDYDIKRKGQIRSLDANAKMWAICDEIAKAVSTKDAVITKEDVYRRNIRDVGIYFPYEIREDAIDDFIRRWTMKGDGWVVDIIDDSPKADYKLIFAYFGSSTYLTHEMSRLIDSVIQDAQSVGIDVMSEREKSLLLDAWEKKHEPKSD